MQAVLIGEEGGERKGGEGVPAEGRVLLVGSHRELDRGNKLSRLVLSK